MAKKTVEPVEPIYRACEMLAEILSRTSSIENTLRILLYEQRAGYKPEDRQGWLNATELGKLAGMKASDVNQRLHKLNFLEGKPGKWALSRNGCSFGAVTQSPVLGKNSYQGYSIVWNPLVANFLKDGGKS